MKSKNLTTLALATILSVTSAIAPVTTTQAIVVGCPDYLMVGDPTEDGYINSADASFVLNEYAKTSTGGGISSSTYKRVVADVNKDGAVNSADASLILRHYAEESTGNSITSFPNVKLDLISTFTIPHTFEVIDFTSGNAIPFDAFTPFKLEGVSNGTAIVIIGNNGYTLYFKMYTDDICVYPT